MANWWRMHNSIKDSRKHLQISAEIFRDWVLCCSIANEFDEKNGTLPDLEDIAWSLHTTKNKAKNKLDALEKAGLIDLENGIYRMHDFASWQYQNGETPKQKSSSYERVKAYRERQSAQKSVTQASVTESVTAVTKSVTVTPMKRVSVTHETPSRALRARSETETETETETELALQRFTASSGLSEPLDNFLSAFVGPVPDKTYQTFAAVVKTPGQLQALIENTPLWMQTAAYKTGFHNAVAFLESGVWKKPPKPQMLQERKGAHDAADAMVDELIKNGAKW